MIHGTYLLTVWLTSFQLRKSSRPNPVLKFFDVHRLLRTIDDDDDDDRKAQADYDESDDEEDVVLRGPGEDTTLPLPPVMPSCDLPLDKEVDFDLSSSELRQILADAPSARKIKKSVTASSAEEERDGGNFELGAWI